MEGVIAAEVSYDDKLAKVRYVAEQLTTRQMIEAIDATGFSAALLETETGIAWVVGHRIADWAKVPPGSGDEVLWINFSQEQTP